MPASITVCRLAWSTPDGRAVLSNLDLSFGHERTGLVGRNGVGKSTLLKLIAGDLPPQSGDVSITGRLGVLRQTVQANARQTVADLFGASEALAFLRRAELGDADADGLSRADWTLEAQMSAALGRLGLEAAPETLLSTLSGGQRTRAGLAALVFDEPDFILLDEPTNNLDRDGRHAVIELLTGWRGGAIVISHDRELLETLDAIVELTGLGATRYGGNFSHYRERKTLELAAAEHDLADAERRVANIAERAQATAERKARSDRAGQRRRSRGDIPRIQLNTLRNRSEATGGKNARLAARRHEQAVDDAATARRRIEVLQPLTVAIPPTKLPASKPVLRIDAASAGYDDRPVIHNLTFAITGPERIAVTGANGSGKTTLLALIVGQLVPWAGTVRLMTEFAQLDQQVSLLDPTASIRDNFRRLNPDADENACRASLARFKFRADAALQSVAGLSGGELLRAGLACVLGARPPQLLILDEPTNNLDLDSIAAVEAGLCAYDGALLVVSHDEAFLEAIGITRRLAIAPCRA